MSNNAYIKAHTEENRCHVRPTDRNWPNHECAVWWLQDHHQANAALHSHECRTCGGSIECDGDGTTCFDGDCADCDAAGPDNCQVCGLAKVQDMGGYWVCPDDSDTHADRDHQHCHAGK